MNHRTFQAALVFLLAGFALVSIPAAAQQTCESLKSIEIPNITITSVTAGSPGYELSGQAGAMGNIPARKVQVPFCRIEAFSAPTGDSHIGIEVWLPAAADWNGKFLAAGNPGFIGSLSSGGLAGIMERGYVAAGTDTGHVDAGFEWAIGHPEKWADWGYRAVHEMVVVTKTMAEKYYGKPIEYSYWNSCHNGGNQGLNEAQRYPDDFDGIVASDPAFWISRLQPGSLYISWVALKDGVDGPGYIPTAKLAVIHRAALDACDANDGLVDGLIEDPTKCEFDPASIRCPGPDEPFCLTAAQVNTVQKIYEGAKFNDGTPIYTGFERGSEMTWAFMIEKEPFSVNLNYFKGLVFEDPDWDFRTFDVDRDTRRGIAKTGDAVDGNNPDLRPLKKAGGKLIIVSSWNSLALPPRQVVEYYKSVEEAMGGPEQTRDFARLFSIPGAGGCVVGENFQAFEALQAWVEEGKAPEQIIYGHTESDRGGRVYRTRPVCAYPKVSKYKGSGDINDAANFTCVSPED
ncbi:MAG: tannase/feruloyl esterase family alpha/beta hydrolase [Acidobacteria bacterium]|nr:tannase/feruloyl esterase family alpha/beta hydrolase [Acidobacteriota bacterium]